MSTSCTTPERLVTSNGTVWTLREVDGNGNGRYAPEGVTVRNRLTMDTEERLRSEFNARAVAESRVPDLSARVDVTWSHGLLRVDAIQRRTLLEMAAAWNEQGAEDDIVSAMTVLADTVAGDSTLDEESAAVEAVTGAAMLQNAEVELSLDEARRLRDELDKAIARLERREVPSACVVSERAA